MHNDAQQALSWLSPNVRMAMLRFAKPHLQPKEEAEDAVQDVVLVLLEHPEKLEQIQDIKRYLFGILKNKITDRLRQKYRTSAREIQLEVDDLDQILFNDKGSWVKELVPARWSSVEEQLTSEAFFIVVDACVNDLPPKIARVFSMKELLECDTQEICEVLNLSQSDYWQCMSRARKKLQVCLNIRWFEGK